MIRLLAFCCLATPAMADLDAVLDTHVLPRMDSFAAAARDLAQAPCDAMSDPFAETALAWAAVSHLALGPAEEGGRASAILFWPDDRDATRRGLQLLEAQGPDAWTPEALARASVAARGLGALERLIFEADTQPCDLIKALARDLAATAGAVNDGWRGEFGQAMRTAGQPGNTRFLAPEEAEAAFFTVLVAGLTHIAEDRLGRPMGTFERPRPARAELRRSGLSMDIVIAALTAQRELASALAPDPRTDAVLSRALDAARALPRDALARTEDLSMRFRVEALQSVVREAAGIAQEEIGDALAVQAGFNAGDGD